MDSSNCETPYSTSTEPSSSKVKLHITHTALKQVQHSVHMFVVLVGLNSFIQLLNIHLRWYMAAPGTVWPYPGRLFLVLVPRVGGDVHWQSNLLPGGVEDTAPLQQPSRHVPAEWDKVGYPHRSGSSTTLPGTLAEQVKRVTPWCVYR